MDRRARQATVHGVSRVRHNLATKPPLYNIKSLEKNLNVDNGLLNSYPEYHEALKNEVEQHVLFLKKTSKII